MAVRLLGVNVNVAINTVHPGFYNSNIDRPLKKWRPTGLKVGRKDDLCVPVKSSFSYKESVLKNGNSEKDAHVCSEIGN